MELWVWGLDSEVPDMGSGFGVWVWGLRFWVWDPDLPYRALGLGSGLRFWVWGLGFQVWASGSGVPDMGSKDVGLGFWVWGLGLEVWDPDLPYRALGLGSGVWIWGLG